MSFPGKKGVYMSVSIPGISALYAILKRNIDRDNDVLNQRKNLASQLKDNCYKWVEILEQVFSNAEKMVDNRDYLGAKRAVENQMDDFLKLNYKSLKTESPILIFLDEDERFSKFVDSCENFYRSALDIKKVVYRGVRDADGYEVRLEKNGLSAVRNAWRYELESMIDRVNHEYMMIEVIKPK